MGEHFKYFIGKCDYQKWVFDVLILKQKTINDVNFEEIGKTALLETEIEDPKMYVSWRRKAKDFSK